jgi:hypothetical protein
LIIFSLFPALSYLIQLRQWWRFQHVFHPIESLEGQDDALFPSELSQEWFYQGSSSAKVDSVDTLSVTSGDGGGANGRDLLDAASSTNMPLNLLSSCDKRFFDSRIAHSRWFPLLSLFLTPTQQQLST